MKTAYERLFQPLWEEAVNEQFFIDHPHWRPETKAEWRNRQERLRKLPQVVLQVGDGLAGGTHGSTALPEGIEPGSNRRDRSRDMHSSTGREGDRPPGLYADELEGFGRWKMPVSMGYEGVRGSEPRAGVEPAKDEKATNATFPLKSHGKSGTIKEWNITRRSMSNGLRISPYHVLTDEEINLVLEDAKALNIPASVLRFNEKNRTGFYETENLIYIRGDILPDTRSTNLRDNLSQRAVLAHEYYGHYLSHPSKFQADDWRDEFQASYKAAVNAPNLTDMEKRMLMLDAYDRAKEAGVRVIYNMKARELIYGFD